MCFTLQNNRENLNFAASPGQIFTLVPGFFFSSRFSSQKILARRGHFLARAHTKSLTAQILLFFVSRPCRKKFYLALSKSQQARDSLKEVPQRVKPKTH